MIKIKQGDDWAQFLLFEKYRIYSNQLAACYLLYCTDTTMTFDDLTAICFSSVQTALEHYESGQSFYPYWKTIAIRNMVDYIKEYKKEPTHLSLDKDIVKGLTLHDVVSVNVPSNDLAFSLLLIIEKNPNDFSSFEKAFFNLYLQGYEMKDISEILSVSLTKSYRTLRKIIKKFRHFLINKK